jgi:hypothetical protein
MEGGGVPVTEKYGKIRLKLQWLDFLLSNVAFDTGRVFLHALSRMREPPLHVHRVYIQGLIWVLTFTLFSVTARGAILTWTNATSGGWGVASCWSPNQVPGPSDTAVLSVSTQIDLSNSIVGVGSLRMSAGELINGTLSVGDDSYWTGGTISAPLTILSNAVLNIGGSSSLVISGPLTNAGTINWSGNATISTGAIYNQAGAVFNAQNDEAMTGGGPFVNAGLFVKSPTSGMTVLNCFFTNTGAIEVESGTVGVKANALLTGSAFLADGTALTVGAYLTTCGAFTVTGDGSLQFDQTELTFNGAVSCSNMVLSEAIIFGTGSISGSASWTSGTLEANSTLTVATNGVLDMGGSEGFTLYGTLNNAGTINWNGTASITANVVLNNLRGGVFNAQNDETLGGEGINNAGLFVKSPTTGTTTIACSLKNSGALVVETGTLHCKAPPAGGGEIAALAGGSTVASGAQLNFSGNYMFQSFVASGPGVTQYTNGVLKFANAFTVSNFLISGGTLSGEGYFDGTISWSNATLQGSLTIDTNAVLNILGSGTASFDGQVTNYGTVNWGGTGSIDASNFYNEAGAVFNAQNDGIFTGYFNNSGTVVKSPTIGVTSIDCPFDNTGTVEVDTGTLFCPDGGTLAGNATVAYGSQFTVSSNVTGGSFTAIGEGVAELTDGVITYSGAATISNLLIESSQVAGNLVMSGVMTLNNATNTGPFTVATNGVLNIEGIGLTAVDGNFTNAGTVNWSGAAGLSLAAPFVNLPGAVFNAQNDQTLSGSSFLNEGRFVKGPTIGTTVIASAFANSGTIAVESGTADLTSSYDGNNGVLSFAISGPNLNGQVILPGTFYLPSAGSVQAYLTNDFLPIPAEAFTLLKFSGSLGSLAKISVPGTGQWFTFDNSTDIGIFLAPNPIYVSGISRNANGSIQLSFTGVTNTVNVVEATTNVGAPSSWTPIYTNVIAGGNTSWQFTDTNTGTFPARFYRLITLP